MMSWGHDVLRIAGLVLEEIFLSGQLWENSGNRFQTLANETALGFGEVTGTQSPCLVEQRVWAEAGEE